MKNTTIIYPKTGCPFCHKAKSLLNKSKVSYKEIELNPMDINYTEKRDALFKHFSHKSYPIIILDGRFIGGYSELANLKF